MTDALFDRGDATFSPDGRYRYMLERAGICGGAVAEKTLLFVMLNPSTADAEVNDPTVRRCIGFAQAWGFGTLLVGNLYAYRATEPRALRRADVEPVGPDNDAHLAAMAERATTIVAAWGVHGLPARAGRVLALLEEHGPGVVFCLGTTADGSPRHPLYLAGSVALELLEVP